MLVLFFALLPIPMAIADWSDATVWTVCSPILGSWFIVGDILALPGERKDRVTRRLTTAPLFTPVMYGVYVVALAMGIVLWLSAFDIAGTRGQALYVVGLMVLLAFAAVEFLFFIGVMSRESSNP